MTALRLLSYGWVDMAASRSAFRPLSARACCWLHAAVLGGAAECGAALRLIMTGRALYPMLLTAPQLPLLQPPL